MTESFRVETRVRTEMTSSMSFVFGAYAWFVCGYMHCGSLRSLQDAFTFSGDARVGVRLRRCGHGLRFLFVVCARVFLAVRDPISAGSALVSGFVSVGKDFAFALLFQCS